jgi:kynurenine formamidase
MEPLIDLTQPIYDGMTKYPVQPDVRIDVVNSRLRGHMLHAGSHVGTHIDAPIHIVDGGKRIGEIELDRFRGRAVVASVSRNAGESISVDDIVAGGPQPRRGDVLIVHTGWDQYFIDTKRYEDHPWLSVEVAEWAVELGLNMVGVDTLSPDQPIDRRDNDAEFRYPIHRTLLGNDILIIENLSNLSEVSGRSGGYYAFPIVTLAPGGDAGYVRFVWNSDYNS